MELFLKCQHCGAVYKLPACSAGDETEAFEAMHVISDPYSDGEDVWFWSEKGDRLYLNLSCKREMDLVFLKAGQDILSRGEVRKENVHMKWICRECGEESEVNREVPCLVNQDTKIRLKNIRRGCDHDRFDSVTAGKDEC